MSGGVCLANSASGPVELKSGDYVEDDMTHRMWQVITIYPGTAYCKELPPFKYGDGPTSEYMRGHRLYKWADQSRAS